MSFPRSMARAGALALAAFAFTACGSDSTSPLDLDPAAMEAVGESIAMEIEGSALTLTAGGAMGEVEQTEPIFSLGSSTSRRVLGGAAYSVSRLRPAMQTGEQTCGVPSQNPPVDSDEDGVPDNLTITFALPACHTEVEEGSIDITGLFTMSDPTPGTAGFALNFGMTNFRVVFDGTDGRFTMTQNGQTSVNATASGLSQTQDWTQSASASGYGSFGMTVDWDATFAAAPGSSIVVGQPLPNGTFTPNGTFRYSEGRRVAVLNVTTTTPLQYSAECAAQYAEGMAESPFTAGEVRVAFSGDQGSGYVRIRYTNCTWADVVFIGVN